MKTEQKNTKLPVLLLIALAAVILILLCVHQYTKEEPVQGQKTVTIHVVHKDQSVNTFEITTTREYLGEVLKDENLAEGEEGPYGMYIVTADKETADETAQEWWCITKGEEQVNTSADQTPLKDKDEYELTLMTGY